MPDKTDGTRRLLFTLITFPTTEVAEKRANGLVASTEVRGK